MGAWVWGFQCLAVLDFSEESSVLGFFKNNQNGLVSSFTTKWNLGFSSGQVLEKKLNSGFVLLNPGPVWECAWIEFWGEDFAFTNVCVRGCNEGEFQALPKWESAWEVQVSIVFEFFLDYNANIIHDPNWAPIYY